jgi:UDP-glucuronate 4-epimerase
VFAHILKRCRLNNVEHLVYASSSSVYGANTAVPFSLHHNFDHPLSLFAENKKGNKLIAQVYSHLYNLATTGIRFFTVYGPWGRPDMALFNFTKAILADEKTSDVNFGNHHRHLTYIDDIVVRLARLLDHHVECKKEGCGVNPNAGRNIAPWFACNIGNNISLELSDYISSL